jgi:hypothetical protein
MTISVKQFLSVTAAVLTALTVVILGPVPISSNESSLIARITSRLGGLETVAHAQSQPCPQNTECRGHQNFCGSVRVTAILCTECGLAWQNGSLWQTDFSAAQMSIGYQDNSQTKCGDTSCGCNLDECSCMGG